MTPVRFRPLLVLLVAALPAAAQPAPQPAAGAPAAFDPSRSDPRAIAVADRVLGALGGGEAWAATRHLHFTFAVRTGGEERTRRTHLWDRATGRHRVEGLDREGRRYVILHTLGDTLHVTASLAGEPVTDPAMQRKMRERAHALWVNDTYWLLMPYKLEDPGVMLAYEGEKSEGGRTWDVVRLSFDGVGLTPGDRYWAFVNQNTGLMDRWEFRLEGMKPEDKPGVFEWRNWRRYGRIMLSDTRVSVGEPEEQRIFFPDLAVFGELPDAAFTSTAPLVLPGM
jgi:hypothetical protein